MFLPTNQMTRIVELIKPMKRRKASGKVGPSTKHSYKNGNG